MARRSCAARACLFNATRSAVKPVFWLHIPKCGTSFGGAVYHYACRRGVPAAAAPKPGASEMYMLELLGRYPPEKHCDDGRVKAFTTPPVTHPASRHGGMRRGFKVSRCDCDVRRKGTRA
jgi:hypothetical protein